MLEVGVQHILFLYNFVKFIQIFACNYDPIFMRKQRRNKDSTILLLSSLCDCAARFVSDLVGNTEYRFCHVLNSLLSDGIIIFW